LKTFWGLESVISGGGETSKTLGKFLNPNVESSAAMEFDNYSTTISSFSGSIHSSFHRAIRN